MAVRSDGTIDVAVNKDSETDKIKETDDKVKAVEVDQKGCFKKKSELDNDCPILTEACTSFMVNGTPIQETINNCDDLSKFQKVFKLKGSFKYATHNDEVQSGTVFRVFASKDKNDTVLSRWKEDVDKNTGQSIMRKQDFGLCPKNCFIDNGDIRNKPIPEKLDKQWYIDKCIDMIENFGYEFEDSKTIGSKTKKISTYKRTDLQTGEEKIFLTKTEAAKSIGTTPATLNKYMKVANGEMKGYKFSECNKLIRKNEPYITKYSEISKDDLYVPAYEPEEEEQNIDLDDYCFEL